MSAAGHDQGAEYDVMPCLAEFKEAELIDDPLLIQRWRKRVAPEIAGDPKELAMTLHVLGQIAEFSVPFFFGDWSGRINAG